jgi:titin
MQRRCDQRRRRQLDAADAGSFVAATVPSAPTLSSVHRASNGAVVAFSANGNGSDAITGYTATCTSSNGGTTRSASGVTSPVTVSNLTNGKTYTCTILATNTIGDGTASAASSSFTAAAVPDAPTLTGVTRGADSVDVAFTANSDGGDTVTGYTATCTSSDGGTTESASDVASPITVDSLSIANTYTCNAFATNTVGDGAPSADSGSFVAATAPDAPTLTGVTRGQNAVEVAFTANGDEGDPITGYTATCTSSDGGTTKTGSDVGSPVTVGSLTNGKTYSCTVVATNTFGNSFDSNASSNFTAATVPVAPTIGAKSLVSNGVSVGFTANSDGSDAITSFTATCVSSDGGTTESGTGASSPVSVSNLTNGKTYTCTVVATNTIGDSAASGATSSFVAVGVADAPTITSVDLGANAATVDFDSGADGGQSVTGYTVTCTSTDGGTTRTGTNATDPVTVSNLTNGKTYTCTVVATNAIGDSAASDPTGSFVAGTRPSAPTLTTLSLGSDAAIVAFTPNSDGGSPIEAYSAKCTSSNAGVSRTHLGDASPLTITGLTHLKSYTCKVAAINEIGTSAYSAASSSFIAASYPSAPTLTTTTRGLNAATVAFTANGTGGNAITGYTATCTSSDGGTTESGTGASSPIAVSSLTDSNTYTCAVVATNAVGDSAPSASSNSFIAATSPDAPTIGAVTQGVNSATVAFTPGFDGSDAVTSFTMTCTSSDGGTTRSASGASSPLTVATLSNGNTYTCSATATNSLGTSGSSATTASFVAGTVPTAPSIGAVTRGNNSASVAFSANANGGNPITGFTVTCTSSDGGTTRSASGASSPINVTTLSNGNTYTCTVVATNISGNSAASFQTNSFIAAATPSAPVISNVTRGPNSAIVTFATTANGDPITSNTVTCTSSNAGVTKTASGASSPITVASLTNAKTYTCTVTSTNTFGTSPASAASASFVAATTASAPVISAVTHTSGSASVSFTAPTSNGGAAITSYTVTCTSTNGGATKTASGTKSPTVVTALTVGKTYTCKVAAVNAIGTGASSVASAAFTD